jgi:hypothetical protein
MTLKVMFTAQIDFLFEYVPRRDTVKEKLKLKFIDSSTGQTKEVSSLLNT